MQYEVMMWGKAWDEVGVHGEMMLWGQVKLRGEVRLWGELRL